MFMFHSPLVKHLSCVDDSDEVFTKDMPMTPSRLSVVANKRAS